MKVHYISPYSQSKNIGKAINDAIAVLNIDNNDWIVLSDHDVLFLLPDTKLRIEQILAKTDYNLLGCLTNRVSARQQRLTDTIDNNDSILHHIQVARRNWQNNGHAVELFKGDVAGFLMCFKKQTWIDHNQFEENSLVFDRYFTRAVRLFGGKVGIMKGIYVWHTYRLESDDPRNYVAHLK